MAGEGYRSLHVLLQVAVGAGLRINAQRISMLGRHAAGRLNRKHGARVRARWQRGKRSARQAWVVEHVGIILLVRRRAATLSRVKGHAFVPLVEAEALLVSPRVLETAGSAVVDRHLGICLVVLTLKVWQRP